ncbi:MAG: anti-sigma F factor [Clostridiales bacterium]|nr:anti-sigma F factor [Clostridiales bacterium]
MDNFMSLSIAAKSCNEAFARSVVAAFATPLNPTVDEINDIKTAVSEAVTNCIVHAYSKDESGIICIDARLDGNTIHIAISDKGVGIEDIIKARQPFYTTKGGDDERSGLGFTVMETFMDSLTVAPNGDKGVVVTMSKAINTEN